MSAISAGWWHGGEPSTQRMSSRAIRWICSTPWAPGSLTEYSISSSSTHLPVRWVQQPVHVAAWQWGDAACFD
jgi:hypothetical protein